MQRRAAAVYATILILLAAGAFLMIGVTEEPAVAIENPDITVSEGESVTVDGRLYNETDGVRIADAGSARERNATLLWVNSSEKQTTVLENNTEVPVTEVSWPGQNARQTVTFQNGSTVTYDGTEYTVRVAENEFTLQAGDDTTSFQLGDTVVYQGNETIVVEIDDSVTLAWGQSYNVTTQTPTNDSVRFTETFNVSDRLRSDQAVDNETVTREDGQEYVVYRNGTVQLLSAYLPTPEVVTFEEGEEFTYDTDSEGTAYETVTIENVSAERVLLSWRSPVEHSVLVERGENVTLGGNDRQYVADFPDNETMHLSSDLAGYQEQLNLQDAYSLRVNGLWGIVILAGLAAMLIMAGAYLPSRY